MHLIPRGGRIQCSTFLRIIDGIILLDKSLNCFTPSRIIKDKSEFINSSYDRNRRIVKG